MTDIYNMQPLAGFLLIATAIMASSCTSQSATDTQNCEKVAAEMTEEEVELHMGAPATRSESEFLDREHLMLRYSEPFGASGAITIVLLKDSNGGFVVDHKWCEGAP